MVVNDKDKEVKGAPARRIYPTFAEGYKLLECVGRGSEGSVWRAMCIPTKKEVAIKIIDLESLPSTSIAEIHEQIQAMYSCSRHPHVVRYYTSFVNGTSLWCVMKYLSGGSCSDIMRLNYPNGMDEAAIKIILKDTLKALDYFHSNGRIHRDIKAGNIIVSESGTVQVADFGVSGSLLVEQLRTTLCGSPCWMAPEVMLRAWPQGREQSSGYDCAVDIWSLGITALELAKGRPPFSEFAPSRVFSMVVTNPPPSLDDTTAMGPLKRKFSNGFKDFVTLCLQKDPAQRPSAAKLLKHKFFKNKKSREYLVNNLLADLPSPRERSSMMSIPQALPVMHPSGAPERVNWTFSDEDADPFAFLAASLESATYLGTSSERECNLDDDDNDSDAESECSDTGFFDAYFVAPTPSNTLQGGDLSEDKFDSFPSAPTPANTLQSEDLSERELGGFPCPPTPANTLQSSALSECFLGSFPARLPPASTLRSEGLSECSIGSFCHPAPTPANTLQSEDLSERELGDFPCAAPTPSNTLQSRDFSDGDFDDFPTGGSYSPAPTPANTMQSADFSDISFASFPGCNSTTLLPAPTPANTMQSADFENEIMDEFPYFAEVE